MKKLISVVLLLLFVLSSGTFAQDKKEGSEPKFEMVQYYFCILMKGPNRTHPDSVAQKIQAGHMANINKMAEDGKLLCAGPFTDDKGGGIFILNVKTETEARKLIENDPAVKAGRLIYELRPWIAAKGTFKNEK
jgi:uncharacterized protein YciI